jgi:acyl-CoA thioester hydrolase
MGYVYYGNYAAYFEVGRVEAMRKVGIEYAKLESEHNIWMPVMNMQCRFLRPGRYDEELTIITQIRKLPDTSISFDYEVLNEAENIVTSARVNLCFIDAKTEQRIEVPTFIIEKLLPYFES